MSARTLDDPGAEEMALHVEGTELEEAIVQELDGWLADGKLVKGMKGGYYPRVQRLE